MDPHLYFISWPLPGEIEDVGKKGVWWKAIVWEWWEHGKDCLPE